MALLGDSNARGAIFDEFFSQKVAGLILREASNGNYQSAVTGGLLLLKVNKDKSAAALRYIWREYSERWLPDMVHGMKFRQGHKKAPLARHGTKEEQEKWYKELQAAVDRVHQEHPSWLITIVRLEAAERCPNKKTRRIPCLKTMERHTDPRLQKSNHACCQFPHILFTHSLKNFSSLSNRNDYIHI